MNDLKELSEINADEALKSIAEIFGSERLNENDALPIDEKYFDSADYLRKCNRFSKNPVLNEAMYVYSKEALKHRSGTPYEDMYAFDGRTGKIIAKQTDSAIERAIKYTNETKRAFYNCRGNAVTFHTHPNSMPPSPTDFNTAYDYGCTENYIICHNGRIFKYASYEKIDQDVYDFFVRLYLKQGKSDFEAQLMAIRELSADCDIKLWEVD